MYQYCFLLWNHARFLKQNIIFSQDSENLSSGSVITMLPNGPAIWGGCVTRRSTGQGPGTLARKLSRCKEGMAHFLPSWYKFY